MSMNIWLENETGFFLTEDDDYFVQEELDLTPVIVPEQAIVDPPILITINAITDRFAVEAIPAEANTNPISVGMPTDFGTAEMVVDDIDVITRPVLATSEGGVFTIEVGINPTDEELIMLILAAAA